MKKTVIVTGLVFLMAAGWFFLSPLFIDQSVDEDFDFVLDSGGIDRAAVMAMPEADRRAMRNEIMQAAASAPDNSLEEAMPESPTAVARGRFTDADAVHKGAGTATLYRLRDGRHAVRFEDFRTTNGPALVVLLAKHPAPKQAADVIDGGYVDLGDLKGNVGNQNYVVLEGVDIKEINSVVIWCELFGVLFSPAPLSRL